MITTLIFLAVISILVFVHELGHFVMAKRAGMKVEEFGFGFPPRAWGIKKGETTYSINWIPFGGFVRIFGEDGDNRTAPRSFGAGTFWQRMKVVLAGVVMNFLFAVLLLIIGNFLGLRVGLFEAKDIAAAKDQKVQIVEVVSGSPASNAGLQLLDAVEGFNTVEEFQNYTASHKGETIELHIKRGQEELVKNIQLRSQTDPNQGYLGVGLALTGVISRPWYVSLYKGFYDAAIIVVNTFIGFWLLFRTLLVEHHLLSDVSGPIGIATLTGQAARIGFNYLIQFVAMISINLAVLNIIPFPALDGGRALMLIIEKIKGSPVNQRVEGFINAAGFAMLIALMIIVTVRDISKFF